MTPRAAAILSLGSWAGPGAAAAGRRGFGGAVPALPHRVALPSRPPPQGALGGGRREEVVAAGAGARAGPGRPRGGAWSNGREAGPRGPQLGLRGAERGWLPGTWFSLAGVPAHVSRWRAAS